MGQKEFIAKSERSGQSQRRAKGGLTGGQRGATLSNETFYQPGLKFSAPLFNDSSLPLCDFPLPALMATRLFEDNSFLTIVRLLLVFL